MIVREVELMANIMRLYDSHAPNVFRSFDTKRTKRKVNEKDSPWKVIDIIKNIWPISGLISQIPHTIYY